MIFCPDGIIPDSGLTGPNDTHTHTHTHTYIYIYMYIYIYIYIYKKEDVLSYDKAALKPNLLREVNPITKTREGNSSIKLLLTCRYLLIRKI